MALTICVASAALSFADSSLGSVELAFFDPAVFPDLGVLVTRPSDDRPAAGEASLGRSSAFNVTVVVGEQVETLDTALLTASTCVCVVAI